MTKYAHRVEQARPKTIQAMTLRKLIWLEPSISPALMVAL